MATVPTDGTEVMLADDFGFVVKGYWDGSAWIVEPSGPMFEPVKWMPVPPVGENSL